MAFERPTLPEIVGRVEQDYVSRLTLDGTALLRRAVVRVLARVNAGAAHMLYGALDYLSRQLFADISDGPFLLRDAAVYGMAPTPAAYATGSVTVLGTSGALIASGTRMRSASGTEYESTADAVIAGGSAQVSVRAELSGTTGNATAGLALTFESPVPGVSATAVVSAGGLAGGSDEEDLDTFRARFLARRRSPPQGGASSDYVAWAKAVPGVTRAWVYPRELGAGTVVVRFMRDGDSNPFPAAQAVSDVKASIDARRPVTAAVTVLAPLPVDWDFDLRLAPDTPATRGAVQAAIGDLFRAAQPGETVTIQRVWTAIGSAAGVYDFVLNSPTTDLVHDSGRLPRANAWTWSGP